MTAQSETRYRDLATIAEQVLGEIDESPEYLYRTLLQAYTADEVLQFPQIVDSFVATYGDRVRAIVSAHSPGAPEYVERYDVLYRTAEVILIAERSMKRPRMLRSIITRSDFEDILQPMIDTFSAV